MIFASKLKVLANWSHGKPFTGPNSYAHDVFQKWIKGKWYLLKQNKLLGGEKLQTFGISTSSTPTIVVTEQISKRPIRKEATVCNMNSSATQLALWRQHCWWRPSVPSWKEEDGFQQRWRQENTPVTRLALFRLVKLDRARIILPEFLVQVKCRWVAQKWTFQTCALCTIYIWD